MKYLMYLLALVTAIGAKAQDSNFNKDAIIPAYNLQITTGKTTLLIFPAAIQSADRGNRFVLAEKIKNVDNVLKVKAGQQQFDSSTLHVITSDGKVYAFNVSYAADPGYQTLDLRKQSTLSPVEFKDIPLNSVQLSDCVRSIALQKGFIKHVRDRKYGLSLVLDGIYVKSDVLFFRYRLKNTTAIRYEIGSMRFYIRDKEKIKRTAEQDKETLPAYTYYEGAAEKDKGETIVVAFPKFTIAEDKYFVTEITEKGGDRNPACRLDQGKLLEAQSLNR